MWGKMDKFNFEFAGFQDDMGGGVFPLFTVIHKFDAHPSLLDKTTLSGKSLSKLGFSIPSYKELQSFFKGDIVVLRYRKSENIPLENRISN